MTEKINWKPILEMKNIETRLTSISNALYQSKIESDYSLLGGKAGVALFFYYYWLFSKNDKHLHKANSIILKNIDFFANSKSQVYSLCNGNAGFMWTINHLITNSFIDGDCNDLFHERDTLIFSLMKNDILGGKYDFLHNALGAGLYFSCRDNEQSRCYAESLICGLERIAEIDTNGLKWRSTINRESGIEEVYNTGMSHGIASIIGFLCKAYKKNIQKECTETLLIGAVNYLLSLKLEIPETSMMSFFPNTVSVTENKKNNPGRLSWCYSDLSIGIAIWHASQVLKNKDWERIAISVLMQTTLRTNPIKEFINDAGICHGSAGIAHIYNRIYQFTGINAFRDSAIFWLNNTIEMAVFSDGLAGYKAYRTERCGGLVNKEGILEGIAGIGLVLLSATSNIEPKWDECLLLS
jgi:lantibiotic modifying enzyme